jgi:hypothetical protein
MQLLKIETIGHGYVGMAHMDRGCWREDLRQAMF